MAVPEQARSPALAAASRVYSSALLAFSRRVLQVRTRIYAHALNVRVHFLSSHANPLGWYQGFTAQACGMQEPSAWPSRQEALCGSDKQHASPCMDSP